MNFKNLVIRNGNTDFDYETIRMQILEDGPRIKFSTLKELFRQIQVEVWIDQINIMEYRILLEHMKTGIDNLGFEEYIKPLYGERFYTPDNQYPIGAAIECEDEPLYFIMNGPAFLEFIADMLRLHHMDRVDIVRNLRSYIHTDLVTCTVLEAENNIMDLNIWLDRNEDPLTRNNIGFGKNGLYALRKIIDDEEFNNLELVTHNGICDNMVRFIGFESYDRMYYLIREKFLNNPSMIEAFIYEARKRKVPLSRRTLQFLLSGDIVFEYERKLNLLLIAYLRQFEDIHLSYDLENDDVYSLAETYPNGTIVEKFDNYMKLGLVNNDIYRIGKYEVMCKISIRADKMVDILSRMQRDIFTIEYDVFNKVFSNTKVIGPHTLTSIYNISRLSTPIEEYVNAQRRTMITRKCTLRDIIYADSNMSVNSFGDFANLVYKINELDIYDGYIASHDEPEIAVKHMKEYYAMLRSSFYKLSKENIYNLLLDNLEVTIYDTNYTKL